MSDIQDTNTTTNVVSDEMLQQQINRELAEKASGITRREQATARLVNDGRESKTVYGMMLLKRALEPVALALKDYLKNAPNVCRNRGAIPLLKMIDPYLASFIGCRIILNCLSSNKTTSQALALGIGNAIWEELRFQHFSAEDPKGFFKAYKEGRDNSKHIHANLNNFCKKQAEEYPRWPKTDTLHVGMKIIDIFLQHTGLVQFITEGTMKDMRTYVRPTPLTEAWLKEHKEAVQHVPPTYRPMIIPPMDWTSPYNGGYVTNKVKFVKGGKGNYLKEVNERPEQFANVYSAINAMQRTPWQINKFVLEVADTIVSNGHTGVAGLPATDDIPIVPCPLPEGMHYTVASPELQKEFVRWRQVAEDGHSENFRLKSKRILTLNVLNVAKECAQYDTIYFPYNVDFRGRVYAIPQFLTPQGPDLSKALLKFANGKPLGTQEAADWLAIQGANTYGVDKVSFADRISWVKSHEDYIRASVKEPLGCSWWMDADSPFQFLAWCQEWVGYLDTGLDFVSSIPIALDGSCNGLQHFSALLRDEEGGSATNLVPNPVPQDIYQIVADKVTEKLKKDGQSEDEAVATLANMWLEYLGGTVPRKATKRAVMVMPYGGTLTGARVFVDEFMQDHGGDIQGVFKDKRRKAVVYFAQIKWEAIGNTVIAAKDAMKWLRTIANKVSKRELPVCWTAPSGFIVQQQYHDSESRRVKTKLGDKFYYLSIQEDKQDTINARKQANGVSPNFVHSLDASAMTFAINYSNAAGIEHFAMVHDSFGTLAADTSILAEELRKGFVDMHKMDIMGNFKDEISMMMFDTDELPHPPSIGSLRLDCVLDSPYFFA